MAVKMMAGTLQLHSSRLKAWGRRGRVVLLQQGTQRHRNLHQEEVFCLEAPARRSEVEGRSQGWVQLEETAGLGECGSVWQGGVTVGFSVPGAWMLVGEEIAGHPSPWSQGNGAGMTIVASWFLIMKGLTWPTTNPFHRWRN